MICLLLSFYLLPVVNNSRNSAEHAETVSYVSSSNYKLPVASPVEFASNLLYDSLQLDKVGLNKEALLYAYKGMNKLSEKHKLENPDVLTVCDFSQPADNRRMYIIDIKNFKLLLNTYVAHGKNSGLTYAQRFSNKPKSLQSSLGFYITKNVYQGKHGLSLKLTGIEKGFNDKAEARAVVVHGANYIGTDRNAGRSFGCPAVPKKDAAKVISLIKDGTCLFIYYPSKTYLRSSKILNY